MHSRRIVLAFVLAGLAAPALAEKCSVCDFTDEPIVVKPTKQSSGTGAVPGGMTAAPAKPAPTISEIVATKLSDAASPGFISGGSGNDRISSGRANDVMKHQGGLNAAALPQPTATGGGMGAGKISQNDVSFNIHGRGAPRTALQAAAGSGRPAESLSLNFTKIEYKYIPYDAKGPAAGAMGMRR